MKEVRATLGIFDHRWQDRGLSPRKQPKLLNVLEVASIVGGQRGAEAQCRRRDPSILGTQRSAGRPSAGPERRPSSTHGVIGINNAETSNEMFEQRTPPNAPTGRGGAHAHLRNRHKGENQFGAPQSVYIALRRRVPIEDVRSYVRIDDDLAHSGVGAAAASRRSAKIAATKRSVSSSG